jgi:hypothetical protein
VSPTEYLTFRDYYGPTVNAFDAAGQSGRVDELFGELDELFTARTQALIPPRRRSLQRSSEGQSGSENHRSDHPSRLGPLVARRRT